jgi:hypothetical protein
MAPRATRSKAAVAAPKVVTTAAPPDLATPADNTGTAETKLEKEVQNDASRTTGQQRRRLRRNLYTKAKRHQAIEELHKSLESQGKPMSRKEKYALRVQLYQPHRQKAKATSKRVSELEMLVKKQQEEIKELRKLALGTAPKLQPPASPLMTGSKTDEEPDSSPARIRDQLLTDASRAPAGEEQTILEAEEVVETSAGEPMQGVQEATVVTSIEQDVGYPTMPSVEDSLGEEANGTSDDKQEDQPEAAIEETRDAATNSALKLAADTPVKSKEEARDSSAEDSNAGTPRNVRRSPRKKAKRRSFAGHSYVG